MTDGELLGGYRLGRLIGAGGMGEVYLARDLVLDRDVAIKFVTAAHAADPALKARLLQEAQAVASLDHPCICPVYHVGVAPDGRPYMVMQYIEGETLASRLAQGALPVRDALVLCGHIADALAAAHRRGIIHRDLKPQNVMVTPTGAPKLLDFGIAKLLPAPDAETTRALDPAGLTGTHELLGTPSYMSPEQIQQRRIDGRSDLFSLGAILFQCLTGRRPFQGSQSIEVMGQILHVHPPAPSELSTGLDERHDELCRRLLAKEPDDRFQSADEVVGALRLLQPDTSRTPTPGRDLHAPPGTMGPIDDRPWIRRHLGPLLIGGLVVLVAALGLATWWRPALPAPTPDALRWYQRGTELLREGAFHSAAAAFEEALRLFPGYGIAYARLAEARAEIDDKDAAEQALLRVAEHVPNESRLPGDEQLRLQAIRSLVLRDVDRAVEAYRELAQRNPADAGAWLDLGRAQETAGLLSDAQVSLERAIQTDRQYAAGHLHLGIILNAVGRRKESLEAYAEAQRLYRASANVEGETEVLIRRGALLDSSGDFKQARASLEAALERARNINSVFQVVRAQLHLSSVLASEGRSADAERLASDAVRVALAAGLETAAAEGLIDLAATLVELDRSEEAETQLRKAMELADRRAARRIAARARNQLASLRLTQARPADAIADLEPALAFFRQHKYRHAELQALSIASRAHQQLDNVARAHELATEVLRTAEVIRDDVQLALALGTLAATATSLGSLPEALSLRERAEAIHRRQNDTAQLPYDLANRAELLVRVGLDAHADAALQEIEVGIKQGIAVYTGRQKRVVFIRALSAVIAEQPERAVSLARQIRPDPGASDIPAVLGPALLLYAEASQGIRSSPAVTPPKDGGPALPPALTRERQYWWAATHLAAGRAREALAAATEGFEQATRIGNDELAWRLAAVGTVAARAAGQAEDQRTLRSKASEALTRLRTKWGDHAREYESRPDLKRLRTDAGL